jgi:CelD/BcsL family acetyltransferase involved in cellulose biosynthesis
VKITAFPVRDLTPEHLAAWSSLQRAEPSLDSPFFRPEFTRAVASVRNDVGVAVLEEHGDPVGFFPYQRGWWGAGRPVGGKLCDFQGVIARAGLSWSVPDLLRATRLVSWHFDHLLPTQQPFQSSHFAVCASPFMDLSSGFEAYQTASRSRGSRLIGETLRKARKVQREVGPLRFTFHDADPAAFASLLEWKSAQYIESKVPNVLSFPWTVALLRHILAHPSEDFSATLSTLRIAERLAAVHLCLRASKVLHSWFPTYDPSFARYSPGNILLVEMARAAKAEGVARIDLGKGETSFKSSFMSDATQVAEGCAAAVPLLWGLRRAYHRARSWGRTSPLGGPWRLLGRWTRSLRGRLAFR